MSNPSYDVIFTFSGENKQNKATSLQFSYFRVARTTYVGIQTSSGLLTTFEYEQEIPQLHTAEQPTAQ